MELAKDKGFLVLDLSDKRANAKEFAAMMAKHKPSFVFLNGHGDDNLVTGHAGEVLVDYATRDGSATAGVNYLPVSGTLRFPDGETVQTFTIPILDDGVPNANRSVNLTLSNPQGGALLGGSAGACLGLAWNIIGGYGGQHGVPCVCEWGDAGGRSGRQVDHGFECHAAAQPGRARRAPRSIRAANRGRTTPAGLVST